MFRLSFCVIALLFAGVAASPATAAAPHNPFPPYLLESDTYTDLLHQGVVRLKKLEVVEQVSMILRGQMNPNGGWFHPSQSRYSWKWFADRYDKNHDGKITADEWPDKEKSPAEYNLFKRLDRDGDGKITPTDFDWSGRSRYAQDMMMATMILQMLGADNGGKMTKEDWDQTFRELSKGKGFVTPEDVRDRYLARMAGGGGDEQPDPTPGMMLKLLLQGDIGSPFEGPGIGHRAPAFRLKTHDGKGTIALSDLRGKPTVIVFGSFT
jgi:Ca2+-binding EF-hand superfamily protein